MSGDIKNKIKIIPPATIIAAAMKRTRNINKTKGKNSSIAPP